MFIDVKTAVILRKTRSLVMQLLVSYWLTGHQENYGREREKKLKTDKILGNIRKNKY